MKRRTFIITTAAATSIFAVPVLFYKCAKSHRYDPEVVPDILSRFCDEDMIKRIGKQFLRMMPHEASKEKLKKLIRGNDNEIKSAGEDAVSKRIDNKIYDDFRAKHIYVIDGWVLSLTEARQCALFSIQIK